jgi:hypothetical protein
MGFNFADPSIPTAAQLGLLKKNQLFLLSKEAKERVKGLFGIAIPVKTTGCSSC